MALHRKHESMTREEQRARSAARHGLDRGAPSASDLSRGNALAYYGSRRRRPRLSRGLRAALITVASVFLVSGIALAAYVAHINAKINGNVSSDLLSVLTDAQDNEPFYALLLGVETEEFLPILQATFEDILNATEVPAANEVQCGWGANHSLSAAQDAVREFLAHRDEWLVVTQDDAASC